MWRLIQSRHRKTKDNTVINDLDLQAPLRVTPTPDPAESITKIVSLSETRPELLTDLGSEDLVNTVLAECVFNATAYVGASKHFSALNPSQ